MRYKGWKVRWLILLGLTLLTHPARAEEPSKLVLVLGDDSYLPEAAVKSWTGAEVKRELGENELLEFAVVILSNIRYGDVPGAVQESLPEFMRRGGSLLITGGPNSYGSGGYRAVAPLIPFEIRAEPDWKSGAFKPVIPLQPSHPALQGVNIPAILTFNDVNPAPGAMEIAQSAGGKVVTPGRFTPSTPLIAERRVGQGTVFGVAFDLGREVQSGWADGGRFVQNVLTYLVERSPLKPKPKEEKDK